MIEDYEIILSILEENGFETRLVGGAVRDMIMNKIPNDIDIATKATPSDTYHIVSEQNLKKYKIKNLKIIPTGIKHGTLSIILNNNRYEVTTLRSDHNQDGRHANIKFETSWEKDAERRDFTFNALYMDINKKIYDYFGGIKDLKNRHVRFIGNAKERISEDYLRILRYFRFIAQLELNIKNIQKSKDCEIIKSLAKNIKNLSKERIKHELYKILNAKNSLYVLLMMYDLDVLENIIDINTEIIYKIKTYNNLDFISNTFEKLSNIGKLVLLSKFDDFKKFFTDINISKQEKKIFYELTKLLPFDLMVQNGVLKNILFLHNNINTTDIILINSLKLLLNKKISEKYMQSIVAELEEQYHHLQLQNNFHISYNDIKEYDIPSDKISKILTTARLIWSESLGTLDKEKCIKKALLKYL